MRYRPFDRRGLSVSAISLVLDDQPMKEGDRIKLLYAALEAGVNGFELASADPAVARALGEAIGSIERRLVVVSLRLGRASDPPFAADALAPAVERALEATGAGGFNAVVLDEPAAGELTPEVFGALARLRADQRTRMIGLAASDETADAHLAAGDFDLFAAPYNMRSGWRERNRINAAVARNVTVVGYDCMVEPGGRKAAAAERPKGLSRFFQKPDPRAVHAYDFLGDTRGWTSEEISLAYILNEPALATVLVSARSAAQLEKLAAAVDRVLPAGLAAQIEMARFASIDARAVA